MSLTKVTYSMIEGGSIDVRSYGAVCDGVTDDTLAVQAAIDAALAADVALLVNGTCRITATLTIDRAVDSGADNKWFVIFSNTGGGFYVDSAITLFSTALPFTTVPVSSQILFQNIAFEASVNTLNAYVISEKLLRVMFSECSFEKIKCMTASIYTQSIYLQGCVARDFKGVFFNSPVDTFDLKVHQTMVERGDASGASAFNLGLVHGCAITDNVIEGLYGYAISYTAARGFVISGNYFELNVGDNDIKGTDGATLTSGVAIIGNHFQYDPPPPQPHIVWSGFTQGCVSSGNCLNSGGTLHSLAATDQVDISDSTAGGDIADYDRRFWFIDKQYRDKGGYIYGSTTDGDNAFLTLGTRYSNSVQLDQIKLQWDGKTVFNEVDYLPAIVNFKADGTATGISIKNISGGTFTNYMVFVNNANAVAGVIAQTGATTINYGTSSDARLKKDLGVVADTDVIAKTVIHDFEWKDGTKARGVFAQEAYEVNPAAVIVGTNEVNDNGELLNPWSVDYSKYVPDLIVELQSLRKRVAELEALAKTN